MISCEPKTERIETRKTENKKVSSERTFKRGEEMSNPNNILVPEIHNLELSYITFGCACPNWIEKEDLVKDGDNLNMDHYIFIEPENSKLELPQSFDVFKNNIKVTGQFYAKKDYPKGTKKGEEELKRAKVFRYTKLEVVPK